MSVMQVLTKTESLEIYDLYIMRFWIFLTVSLLYCTAKAQVSLPDGFLIRWHDDQDYEQPIDIKFDAEGNMYVFEKAGKIWIEKNGERTGAPLIDISDEVGNYGDMGSLGFCLHPDFLENGFFYLFYTVDRYHLLNSESPDYDPNQSINYKATIGRITRYQADINTGFTTTVPGSRFVLIGETKETGIPYLHNSHAGGGILFATDGSLMISTGDGSTWKDAYAGNGPPYFDEYVVDGLNDKIIKEKEEIGAYRAQLLDNYNGKLLRIDPMTGLGLASNPYYDEAHPDAPKSKVWALGLRNPFRTVMRPGKGQSNPELGLPGVFVIGDVGGGAWEDLNINRQSSINYGWPLYEGHRINQKYYSQLTLNQDAPNPLAQDDGCNEDYFYFQDLIKEQKSIGPPVYFPNPCDNASAISPEFVWEHQRPDVAVAREGGGKGFRVSVFDEEGKPVEKIIGDADVPIAGDTYEYFGSCAIAGGFYQGSAFPDIYHDKLFFADYTGGWIKVFELDDGDEIIGVADFFSDTIKISHVELNPHDGALYFVDYPNGIKIISYGQNVAPIAKPIADQYYGASPLTVQFDASESFDPNGDDIQYFWDFDDGSTSSEINPNHSFTASGSGPEEFKVKLHVTDPEGLIGEEHLSISLNNTPPQVSISSFEDGDSYPISGISYLPLEANVFDQEHEDDELSYEWQVYFGHNTHEHPEPPIYKASDILKIYPEICGGNIYYYRIKVIVTDAHGLVGTDEKTIYPNCDNAFVELIEFNGAKQDQNVKLDWLTQTEFDLEKYEIERSSNGSPFQVIHTQTPLNLNGFNAYTHLDEEAETGTNIYRLKITSADGEVVYSDDVTIFFEIGFYPNPARDKINILFGELEEEATFSIYDASGKNVLKQKFYGTGFQRKELSVHTLLPGNYFYEILNGSKKQSGSFIIIH